MADDDLQKLAREITANMAYGFFGAEPRDKTIVFRTLQYLASKSGRHIVFMLLDRHQKRGRQEANELHGDHV